MVEDDQEHGSATEEDGEGVELGVGDHGCWLLWVSVWVLLVLIEDLLGFVCWECDWKVRDGIPLGYFAEGSDCGGCDCLVLLYSSFQLDSNGCQLCASWPSARLLK